MPDLIRRLFPQFGLYGCDWTRSLSTSRMRTTVLRKIMTLIAVPSAGAVAAVCLSLPLCLVLAGCSTLASNTRPRFHGSDQASVVLQYNSPDYIFMTKPSCREEKFLRQIRRPEVAGLLDDMRVPRETAVVSVSWLYEGKCWRPSSATGETCSSSVGYGRPCSCVARTARASRAPSSLRSTT